MQSSFCSHQVLKVSSDGTDRILLALGEAFTPGSDNSHFCQPTDVAVDTETGNIFVSDGYCNARILKFSADGEYLSQWGAGKNLIPRSGLDQLFCFNVIKTSIKPFSHVKNK